MKKTLLITLEFPPFYGGVGYYYFNLVKRLPNEKICVLTNETKTLAENINFKLYRQVLLTKLPIWPKWLLALFKIAYLIKKEKIELIWVGQILPIGTIALILKKFLKLDYLVSCHGTDILTAQKKQRKKKLLIKILKEAKIITANSQYTQQEIVKLGISPEKIIIIYPCANDLPPIDPIKKDKLLTNNNLKNKKILLSVGRLVPRKGFITIIKIFPELLNIFPNLIYLIIGQGPLKTTLEKLIINKNSSNKIKILDNINNEDLPYFYDLADVFILTPINMAGEVEGLGMVFLEASLLAKPIIASATGGIPEAVLANKTGVLVNPEKPQEITQAIIKLLTNKNFANFLGITAKKYVLTNFHWSKEVSKLLNILN